MVQNVNDVVRVIQAYTGAEADGLWGNQTSEYFTEALRVIQAELGLEADGWMGPQTAAAIREAIENGTMDATFGNAVLALYEGETVDRNGNPVSLSQLHSGRNDSMHEANMVQDPQTGKWSVEGGHNAMDMDAIMTTPESTLSDEAPEVMTADPEQPQAPAEETLSTEFGESANDDSPELPPLPEMPEAELPQPTPLPEYDASGDADASPETTNEAEQAPPMPANGPFAFDNTSHGAYMAESYGYSDERYQDLDLTRQHTLYMADVLYDATDSDGNITLAEAVSEYYGQTQFSQSYDELMERAAALGIDGLDTSINLEDPAQMKQLLAIMSGVATGTVDPNNLPSDFEEALNWLEENYNGLITDPSSFEAIPDAFEEIIAVGDSMTQLSAFTAIPVDPVDILTGVSEILAKFTDGDQNAAIIQAYDMVSEGLAAIQTLPDSQQSTIIRELKGILEDHQENLETIADSRGIDLHAEDTAQIAAALPHTETRQHATLAM